MSRPSRVVLVGGTGDEGHGFQAEFWEGGEYVRRPVADFWRFADTHLELEAAPTLGDFFRALSNSFVGFRGLEQLCQLCSADIKAMLIDIKGEPTRHADDGHVFFLEVYPAMDITQYNMETPPETPDMVFYWGFHGWGRWSPVEGIDDHSTEGGIAIELSPLADLRHLELRIKTDLTIGLGSYPPRRGPGSGGRYAFTEWGNVRIESLNFLDFVKAILWELSFLGTPDQRDARAADMRKTIDGIEDGSVKTVPFDDVKARMDSILDERGMLRSNLEADRRAAEALARPPAPKIRKVKPKAKKPAAKKKR